MTYFPGDIGQNVIFQNGLLKGQFWSNFQCIWCLGHFYTILTYIPRTRSLWPTFVEILAKWVVLVRKKDGTIHFCVDYRKLNKCTIKHTCPFPIIDNLMESIGSPAYIDPKSTSYHIDVHLKNVDHGDIHFFKKIIQQVRHQTLQVYILEVL